MLVPVTVFLFCFQVPMWLPCSGMGYQILGFSPLHSIGEYPWQTNVSYGPGLWATPGLHQVAASFTTSSRESLMLLSWPPAIQSILWGHTFGDLAESHDLSMFQTWQNWGSFAGFLPPDDTDESKSVVAIKAGNFSMVIGYQAHEFTDMLWADYFLLDHTFTQGSLVRCEH